ncbi:heme A synthase [Vibrio variabilis]|uniref:Protoheme IX farnesyltransferase n=1 Tax=Vibrio variabilis TaxID=990271 RepID=A0ABQ0JH92_9VIBR|nr:heme A synthase [Vibrio variabilis]
MSKTNILASTANTTVVKSSVNWRVYLTLTKPKVVALMILTALVGMCLAVPGALPVQASVLGLSGIALMAGSAAAFNHLIDRRIDAIMARTHKRPLLLAISAPERSLLLRRQLVCLGLLC